MIMNRTSLVDRALNIIRDTIDEHSMEQQCRRNYLFLHAWSCDIHIERLPSARLEEIHFDGVESGAQYHGAGYLLRSMPPVVVDNKLPIDRKVGAVVG